MHKVATVEIHHLIDAPLIWLLIMGDFGTFNVALCLSRNAWAAWDICCSNLFIVVELLFELIKQAVHLGLHRALRNVQHLRHLLDAEFFL